MAKANNLEARDVVNVKGEDYMLASVTHWSEDGETWIYAIDVNGEELEWRDDEDVAVVETNAKVIDYISECKWCHRPATVCNCP